MDLKILLHKGQKCVRRALITGLASSLLFFSFCQEPVEPEPETEKNNSPVITSSPITQVDENQYYNYQVRAEDKDNDELSYSLTEKPGWLSISSSGLVSGTAPEVSQDQNYPVQVRVSDGEDQDSQSYDLTVKDVPPEGPGEDTYVLPGSELGQISSVEEDRVVFSQSVDYSPGDIIVASISNNTPEGFLREVTSVSGDKRTIYTKQASLEQALREGSFEFQGTLSPSDVQSMIGKQGVFKSFTPTGFDFNISLEDVIIYDHDGNESTLGDQVKLNGNISFDSDFVIKFEIDNYYLRNLTFKIILNEEASIKIERDIFTPRNIPLNDLTIAEYYFHPFIAGYLGLFPIIISPKLEVSVAGGGTIVETQVTQESTLAPGLVYESGLWRPIVEFSNSFYYSPLNIDEDLDITVAAGLKLNLFIYGVIGPFGMVSTSFRFESGHQTWQLYGGLDALLGVVMEIFSHRIAEYYNRVIDYEIIIDEGIFGEDTEPTGKIAFVSQRSGDADIYVMNADGSNPENLTPDSEGDITPSWSRDGTKILFSSVDEDYAGYKSHNIYVMDSDGSNKTQLTNSGRMESRNSPVFSPDGTKIAYVGGGYYDMVHWQIYTMNSDGTNQANITNDSDHPYLDPSWSPDGSKIAFSTGRDGNMEIYKMNPDGSNMVRLTNNSAWDDKPSWSPDASKIAFISNRTGDYEIYIMNADGSNLINISNNSYEDEYVPSWSPDGKWIAYFSGTYENSEIYIIRSDGSNKRRLTNNNYDDYSPNWSP